MENLIEDVKVINEENDIFGTYQKAKSICAFLELDSNKELLEKNNLVAIYGPWGSGKSCLMKTIYNKIDKSKFEVKWFNTWKYEKDNDIHSNIPGMQHCSQCTADSFANDTQRIPKSLHKDRMAGWLHKQLSEI